MAAVLFFFGGLLISGKAASQLRWQADTAKWQQSISLRVLPQNFYNQQLSFFCKKETQLQKLISVPLFIRAGSKDYVDYLEKKPNAVWQPK